MGIYTSSDLFFNTTSNSAGLAYNNKYKLELNVNQNIQNMLDKYKSTGIPELNDNYLYLLFVYQFFSNFLLFGFHLEVLNHLLVHLLQF